DLAGRRDPVEVWHPHVHQDEIRAELADGRDRRTAVAGLADDLDPAVAREHSPEAGTHQVVIVDEQHTDLRPAHGCFAGAHGRRARTWKRSPSLETYSSPARSVARSRMPRMPWPTASLDCAVERVTGLLTSSSSALSV